MVNELLEYVKPEALSSRHYLYITIGVFIVALLVEYLHARRIHRLNALAFGHDERPARWTVLVPLLRSIAFAAITWGLLTLMFYKSHEKQVTPSDEMAQLQDIPEEDVRHLVFIVDVSPSMGLEDAGVDSSQKRMRRTYTVVKSIMDRIKLSTVKYSLIATFTDARPVVIDTVDKDVILNILTLPMEQAFTPGKTNLIKGVNYAFDVAKGWMPNSTTCILVSDGDTVADTGMKSPPASVENFIVAGVGGNRGVFIDGHLSRQDMLSLKRIATRLQGSYEDVNAKHLSSKVLGSYTEQLVKKEEMQDLLKWALISCGCGGLLLMALPLLLEAFGFNRPRHHERVLMVQGGQAHV